MSITELNSENSLLEITSPLFEGCIEWIVRRSSENNMAHPMRGGLSYITWG